MNTQQGTDVPAEAWRAWQAANEARMRAHLDHLPAAEESPLYTQLWCDHFVVVTRSETYLRLWMMDVAAANTQWVQSVLDLADPLHLVLGYTQAMVLALGWQPDPQRVLVSGLGGGVLPLVLHHHLPAVQLDCVEIAEPVVEAATQFFPLQPDERLRIHVDDAGAFLDGQRPGRYDVLFLDLFTDHGSTPPHLTTEAFFRICHTRLRPAGVLTMNLYSGAAEHATRLERLRRTFQSVYVCTIHKSLDVIFATDQPRLSQFDLLQRFMAVQQRRHFRFRTVEWIPRFHLDPEQVDPQAPAWDQPQDYRVDSD